MPVLTLQCPQCTHEFKGMVFSGSKPPERWICSVCGSDKAAVKPGAVEQVHPWDGAAQGGEGAVRLRHPNACPCCF